MNYYNESSGAAGKSFVRVSSQLKLKINFPPCTIVRFNNNAINVGNLPLEIKIESSSIEEAVCRVMITKKKADEPSDWGEIYSELEACNVNGHKIPNDTLAKTRKKQEVRDAVNRINNKFNECFGNKLLKWDRGTIIRLI